MKHLYNNSFGATMKVLKVLFQKKKNHWIPSQEDIPILVKSALLSFLCQTACCAPFQIYFKYVYSIVIIHDILLIVFVFLVLCNF